MQASSSFAPKLLVKDVYSSDIQEWETQDKAIFDFDGKVQFNRVWLQASRTIFRAEGLQRHSTKRLSHGSHHRGIVLNVDRPICAHRPSITVHATAAGSPRVASRQRAVTSL